MKNYKPFVMKLIEIMKAPTVHFIKKTIKTITIKTTTKSMMISFINITLSDQKMDKCTINVSSHNLKPNLYVESIYQFQCEFFFINYTIKYTPQNWLIRHWIIILCKTLLWIKIETILQFSKNICHFLRNTTFSHLSGQKVSLSLITHC